MSQDVDCPFCKDIGFDLVGLKNHLNRGHCDKFNDTPSIAEIMEKYFGDKIESEGQL